MFDICIDPIFTRLKDADHFTYETGHNIESKYAFPNNRVPKDPLI
jgi:hypothetical protein